MRKHSRQSGFTLIELMTVAAIMSILAAIAIPNFLAYRNKAYWTEAQILLGAIASYEMKHKLQTGVYVSCPKNPPGPNVPWDPNMPEWNRIDFNMGGKYYQYEVIADQRGFIAYAYGRHGTPMAYDRWEISSTDLTPIQTSGD